MPTSSSDESALEIASERLIWKHSIINALSHDGKADSKAVLGSLLSENQALKSQVKLLIPRVAQIVNLLNSQTLEGIKLKATELGISLETREKPSAIGGGPERMSLPDLPDARPKEVVMRLAPYPSGPLHIGNARMVILNDEYTKKYQGKLILAFDDTIGSEEKFVIPEAYEMIKESLRWLGVKYSELIYKSDRIPIFYDFAKKLIEKSMAYVCTCSAEELREKRRAGQPCVHRKQSVSENLELWQKMLDGGFGEGEATLRVKTNMNDPNPAFRDRVLLRVVEREHPRVGKKYRVWPLLEFSWAVDDHLLGMTHILRGKDLIIEDIMEDFIWSKFHWKKAHFIHYGLLNVEEAKLSKTASRRAIEAGEYSGWDDPRTWSLQSLEKRGIQAEALRRFVVSMGMSLSDITVPAEILYSENRKIIDSKAFRYFGVRDPAKLRVDGVPRQVKSVRVNHHPDFPSYGAREIPVDTNQILIEKADFQRFAGRDVRLMDLFNVSWDNKKEGAKADGSSASYVGNAVVANMPKIHWVSVPNFSADAIMIDASKLKFTVEPSLKHAASGEIIQLVRVGFFRVGDGERNKTSYESITKNRQSRRKSMTNHLTLYFAHK